jgi:putative sterol carrier protein
MSLENTTQQISALAEKAGGIGNSIKFVFDEGVIYLDGAGERNAVSNEDKDADCTVKVAKEDLDAMLSGDLNPMNAFMGGKLRVEGDMGVAMKLQSLFG